MKKNILIIDEDKFALGALKRILKGEGYDVAAVESGYEALNKIKSNDFHLIISDIKMSGPNGIETLKQIRELLIKEKKDFVPELVITGMDNDNNSQQANELKVAGYITKLFDLKELLWSIENHIK